MPLKTTTNKFKLRLFKIRTKGVFHRLSANPTKWSNTPKTIRRLLSRIVLSVFDDVVGLALKASKPCQASMTILCSPKIVDSFS